MIIVIPTQRHYFPHTSAILLKVISRIVHVSPNSALFLAHNSNPLQGDFKNDTCKSYPEALFPAHISSPFKVDFQNYTCESDPEALILAHSSRPLEGDL